MKKSMYSIQLKKRFCLITFLMKQLRVIIEPHLGKKTMSTIIPRGKSSIQILSLNQ